MSNPVMNSLERSAAGYTPAGYPAMPGYTPGQGAASPGPADVGYRGYGAPKTDARIGADPLEQAYAAPAASAADRERVSYDDIIVRTGLLFVVLFAAAWGVFLLAGADVGLGMSVTSAGAVLALILGIVNAVRKRPSVPLIVLYTLAEGAMVGGLSGIVDLYMPGIVVQAMIATLAVFAVTLVLFKLRVVRASSRLVQVLLAGLIGLVVYRLASVILYSMGVVSQPLDSMRIAGIPLGIIVGVIAVILAVFSLVSDFDVAQRCVEAGMNRSVAWQCAFGFVVTIVWLYLELLRLLEYVRLFSD